MGTGELVKRDTGEVVINDVLTPVALDKVVASFEAYQKACERLLTESDHQVIQGKRFKKKSAWRKLATAYCISTEITEERREDHGVWFVYHFKVRAIANNGRYAEGVGSCSSDEKGLNKTEHNTRTIAETRATNRAIANLIGAGEVSAEEIEDDDEEKPAPSKNGGHPSDAQLKRLHAIKKSNGLTDEEVKAELKKRFSIESTKDLTLAQYNACCDTYMPEMSKLKGEQAARDLQG